MKTELLIVLVALSLTCPARASGPPDIFISTADAVISCRLVDQNRRSERKAQTLEEVEAWSSDRAKEGVGVFMIFPDDRTSFRTVLDLLRRLKAAGARVFAVGATESSPGVEDYLEVKADMIRSTESKTMPPKK